VDAEEKRAIPSRLRASLDFQGEYPLEGYRRLAFMMLDGDIVAVSPSLALSLEGSVYRV